MGKKKATPKAKKTGKTVRVEVVHASKSKQTQKKTPQTGHTSGEQVRFEIVKAGTIPPQPQTAGASGNTSATAQPKQPKITKPAPNQGRADISKDDNVPQYLIVRKGSKLFTFQKYQKIEGGLKKRAKHPKLIVDEENEQYGYMGLTESEKQGHHANIPLTKNPKKGDKRPAYLRREIRYDTKDNFVEVEDYHLSNKDKQTVLQWLAEKKKKG